MKKESKELQKKEREEDFRKIWSNLVHDWDGEIMNLHGEDLWDLPNAHSRHIWTMVVQECQAIIRHIKALPWWKRLFNKF